MPRIITTTTIALLSALVVAGVVSATASAATGFNPAKGTFTSKSGKAKLQIKGGAAIECTASTGKGEITGTSTATTEIKFTSCKALGLGVLSLSPVKGAKEEIVTPTIDEELCYINKAAKQVGVVGALSSTLELEVPTAAKKIFVLGAAIGEVLPINTKQTTSKVTLTQAAGAQGITKCEGGTAKTLLSKEGAAGVYTQSGQELVDEIMYATATEVTA